VLDTGKDEAKHSIWTFYNAVKNGGLEFSEMEAKAIAKYIRVSPQKARLVVDLVRGKNIEEAKKILQFTRKYSAGVVNKVLKSAIANAKQNPNIDESILYVKEIFVDQGPSLKRWRARAQGRAAAIRKRMSHITVILDEE